MIIISQARHKWMQVCHRILTQVDTSGHKWISMLMDMHAIIHHHSKRISCIQQVMQCAWLPWQCKYSSAVTTSAA